MSDASKLTKMGADESLAGGCIRPAISKIAGAFFCLDAPLVFFSQPSEGMLVPRGLSIPIDPWPSPNLNTFSRDQGYHLADYS